MTPIDTAAEGERAIGELAALLEKLTGVVEQETTFVRAGELRNASALEPVKAELAAQLFAIGEKIKKNAKFLLKALPERCAALARVQEKFRAILQRNMIGPARLRRRSTVHPDAPRRPIRGTRGR
jgi:hypothetical protein